MQSVIFRLTIIGLTVMLAPTGLTQSDSRKPKPQPTLRSGAIGVVYQISETPTTVDLKIVFPVESIDNYSDEFEHVKLYYKATAPVQFTSSILIFDQTGPIHTIAKPGQFRVRFWCENDGGSQYHPELRIRLMKSLLRRPLRPIKAIQSIAAFAVAVRSDGTIPSGIEGLAAKAPDEDVRLQGKFDANQKPVAVIRVYHDQDDCDGKPDNGLGIQLRTSNGDYSLRCCGP